MLEVILDVETKKSFNDVGGFFPDRLGVSFVGACIRQNRRDKGEMKSYFENDIPKLLELLERSDVVVGYNVDDFDMQTLVPYYNGDITAIPTLDVMMRIKDSFGHRIKLDSVAKETLGQGKIGNGLDAIKYYRAQQFDKLEKYCIKDVEVTRDIYDYGLKTGKVKFRNKWNRLIECNVDFSFEPEYNAGVQMSLL